VLGTKKKLSVSGSISFQEMELKLDPLSNSGGIVRNEYEFHSSAESDYFKIQSEDSYVYWTVHHLTS